MQLLLLMHNFLHPYRKGLPTYGSLTGCNQRKSEQRKTVKALCVNVQLINIAWTPKQGSHCQAQITNSKCARILINH